MEVGIVFGLIKLIQAISRHLEMLYTAFRSFVDSSDYDPMLYETLTYGDAFALIINDATVGDLCKELISLNADAAEAVIQRLFDMVSDRCFSGSRQSFPIAHYLKTDADATGPKELKPTIESNWDAWDKEQRKEHIKEIYTWQFLSSFGGNLRQMRSMIIENFLAVQEPR